MPVEEFNKPAELTQIEPFQGFRVFFQCGVRFLLISDGEYLPTPFPRRFGKENGELTAAGYESDLICHPVKVFLASARNSPLG